MNKNVTLRAFQIILIIIISAAAGYIYGTNKVNVALKNFKPIVSVTTKNPPNGESLNMKMFYDVFDRVNQDYYDKSKIDANKMVQGAITGMLATLNDPYTSFFPPAQATAFKTQLAGQFSGIGAELSQTTDNKIVVVAPLDDSPAQKNGIKAGDLVLAVDGTSTAGWMVQQAVDKIRGTKGTPVELTILHDKAKSPVTIKIIRGDIIIKSVTGWVKNYTCQSGDCSETPSGRQIAYIRLSQFGDRTNDEWLSTVNTINSKLKDQKNAGLILDLRNNPGGYLNDAVFIASEFIDHGVVVIQEDSAKNQEALSVSRRGTLLDIPIIVLVNKGSASASEITAGALRDHNRAKLLGENSFGKGTVQQAVDLDKGASVHVSVAKWLTPNQTWVHHVGLKPDFTVEFDASKSAKIVAKGIDNQIQSAITELLK